MKKPTLVVLSCIAAAAVSSSLMAGESEGTRFVAYCAPAAAGTPSGAFPPFSVLIYNMGDERAPWFHVVVSPHERSGSARKYVSPSVYSPVKATTLPREEIHFEAPGFKLEVVTNLSGWSDGQLPGTDALHPEQAVGTLWTQGLNGVSVHCEFKP